MNKAIIENYWEAYLAAAPYASAMHSIDYTAERFGDTPELANRLGELITSGIKTATCSALWEWEAEENPLPEVGAITIVLDGKDLPLCIIVTKEVSILPFDQVNAQFAHEEGEGDRSLEYWREAHWKFFSRTLARIGKQPSLDMPLVCERFQLVYKE